MGFWSILLLVLAVVWLSQIVGTYFQMRHYQQVLSGIKQERGEGYIGVGNAKARLGRGVILILVVGEDGLSQKSPENAGGHGFRPFQGGSGASRDAT